MNEISFLFSYVKKHRFLAFWAVVFFTLSTLLMFPLPLIVRNITSMIIANEFSPLVKTSILLVLLTVAKVISQYTSSFLFEILQRKVKNELSVDLLKHFQENYPVFFDWETGYSFSRTIDDPAKLTRFLYPDFVNLVKDIAVFLISLGIAFYFNWIMGLTVLFSVVLFFTVAKSNNPDIRKVSKEAMEATSKTNGKIIEIIETSFLFLLNNAISTSLKRIKDKLKEATDKDVTRIKKIIIVNTILSLISEISYVSVFVIGQSSPCLERVMLALLWHSLYWLATYITPLAACFMRTHTSRKLKPIIHELANSCARNGTIPVKR